ncbi:MAG: hypothetical protein AAB525_02330 [Patescibacteria group bacterium]
MIQKNQKENLLLSKIYHNPKYKGKHIIIIDDKIYDRKTGQGKTKLLNKLLLKYPHQVPTITYIPQADSLILFLA